MMTPTGRIRNTTSLLRWFLPTSGPLGLLEEKPKFPLRAYAKNCPLWSKVGTFARVRLTTPGTFYRISDPAPPQIPIDYYPI